MGMLALRDAARARLRATSADGDHGFMLVYVLMIITIVTVLVASVLVVVSNAIVPAVQSAYDEAAQAAAQGGLQAFVAYLDQTCPAADSSVAECDLTENYSGNQSIPLPNGTGSYQASYTWQAAKDPSNGYFRVRATGTVSQGGVSATKVVIGDVIGGSSLDLLDYGMITGFESESSSTVLRDWPARTITLNNTVINASGVPIKNNAIKWSGTSPGSAAGKVSVCNATYDEKGGRSTDLPPKAPDPFVDWTESGLGGNNYTHFGPCQTSWGTQTELLAPTNPNNGVGGYYSNDAMLLSNSYPGGTGPLFDQPVSTDWQYTSADDGLCGVAPGQNYRSFTLVGTQCGGYPVDVGGSPSPASTYPTVQYGQGPQIPTATPVLPADDCEYNGPTRILFDGDTAVVTSPQTTQSWVASLPATHPAQCYAGATSQGMAFQTVSLVSPNTIHVITTDNDGKVPTTTPAQAHGSSGWPVTGQRAGDTPSTANSVFYVTNGTAGTTTSTPTYTVTDADAGYSPSTGDNPSTKTDSAWTPQWTADTATTTCNATSPDVHDLAFASCYIPKGTYSDSYSWLRAQIEAAVAANPSNYTTASALQTLVDSFTKQGNSTDATSSNPTYVDYRSHRWTVTTATGNSGSCTQSTGVTGAPTTVTNLPAPSSDSFFDNVAGQTKSTPSTDTSCITATVTLQVGTCTQALKNDGTCNSSAYAWGNGTVNSASGQTVPQFSVVFTVKKTTTTSVTNQARSSFPAMNDVTQYQVGTGGTFGASGPGDMYVEGHTTNTMALVAQDDVVVTGSIGATDPNSNTLELVGRNDVRVYHPVSCNNATNESATQFANDIADTDPGFCPNDITGLYTQTLPDGTWPYQQYANLRPDLQDLTIRGAVFALGNSDAHITCPEPPSNDAVCGGEFDVDNYDRGTGLGHVKEIGTLAMNHHAPVGEEYEIADRGSQTGRPYSGYQLAQQYQNVKAIIGIVPEVSDVIPTQSHTTSLWHIQSVSTASNS